MSNPQPINLLSHLADFIVRMNVKGTIIDVSALSLAFLDLPASPIGESISTFIYPDDMTIVLNAREKASAVEKKQSFVCRLLRQRIQPVWMDCHIIHLPDMNEYVLAAFDATHWKENEAILARHSTHDPLTGLPGRALLDDLITKGIKTANFQKQSLALLLIDVDGFKKVNDSLGYSTGDKLIEALAKRLQEVLLPGDALAKVGGDKFALLITGADLKNTVQSIAKKILILAQRPFRIDNENLYTSVSIGITLYPELEGDADSLLNQAEMAMYNAKALGRNRFSFYAPQIDLSKNLLLEAAMHEGILNGEFLLHYQPIFCMRTGKLKGAEALMRWERPGHGLVSPSTFIPLAESSGMIEILGSWALRLSCHQAKLWQESGAGDIYISVNVSANQFMTTGFTELVNKALTESGLAHASLMLEITESILMGAPEASKAILLELYKGGVKIAIDDFGTGYSSLSYLKNFPLSILKIDKSFVNDLPKSTEDVAIVSAILSLAEGLKLTVVAEGVETQAQHDFLKAKGCNLVQGYLTGKPMDSQTFEEKFIL